jgi:hypothetical protein
MSAPVLRAVLKAGVLEVVVLFLGARDLRHRRAETLANALRLFHWVIAKKTLELPAELRCTPIANSIYLAEVGVAYRQGARERR